MSETTYKIRRLKWRQEGNAWVADTSIAGYTIVKHAGMWSRYVDGAEFRFSAKTLREAKAACQEHFDRKVRVFLVRVKQ